MRMWHLVSSSNNYGYLFFCVIAEDAASAMDIAISKGHSGAKQHSDFFTCESVSITNGACLVSENNE